MAKKPNFNRWKITYPVQSSKYCGACPFSRRYRGSLTRLPPRRISSPGDVLWTAWSFTILTCYYSHASATRHKNLQLIALADKKVWTCDYPTYSAGACQVCCLGWAKVDYLRAPRNSTRSTCAASDSCSCSIRAHTPRTQTSLPFQWSKLISLINRW